MSKEKVIIGLIMLGLIVLTGCMYQVHGGYIPKRVGNETININDIHTKCVNICDEQFSQRTHPKIETKGFDDYWECLC